MSAEDVRSNVKPMNSAPMFAATSSEYTIAVATPSHSKILALVGLLFLFN